MKNTPTNNNTGKKEPILVKCPECMSAYYLRMREIKERKTKCPYCSRFIEPIIKETIPNNNTGWEKEFREIWANYPKNVHDNALGLDKIIQNFIAKTLKERELEIIMKIRNEIVELRREFANTPIKERGNGWTWLEVLDNFV